jgi:predicted nucleic acid-binding protein
VSLVVDASVAFKWFMPAEPLAAEAAALLHYEVILIAPDLLVAEVCNTAWRSVRQGKMAPDHAMRIATVLPGLFNDLADAAALAPRAVAVACELDHPVYDCLYLALAEAQHARLVTADTRLLAKLRGTAWQASTSSLEAYAPPKI